MDVLGHAWFKLPGGLPDYKIAEERWLPIFEDLEESTAPLPERCRALLSLITTGDTDSIAELCKQDSKGE
jgi:hypothetical protein